MQLNLNVKIPYQPSDDSNWLPHFPNPADFRFDYYKLMASTSTALASLPNGEQPTVAVIGAGSAGMTAARELARCGFRVDIFESSDRIGGRLYTITNPLGDDQAGMEMGAMRMPFFSKPGDQNSLLEYYMLYEAGLLGHEASFAQFPNPGTAPGGTGIYLNDGYGPGNGYDVPTMITWPYGGETDNQTINALSKKATAFVTKFVNAITPVYLSEGDAWPTLWANIIKTYEGMTFDDLVILPSVDTPNLQTGDFGGFGMTDEEATLLYTIGTGDGSWGAFYSISSLWFIRCTMFGFGGAELQTITGLGAPGSLPYYGQNPVDSAGLPLPSPVYQGIQSLVEYLYYVAAPGTEASLHDNPDVALFTQTEISDIEYQDDGTISVTGPEMASYVCDYVFVSATQWATQMSLKFSGFTQQQLPQAKMTAEHTQHNISSCKLFFPLIEKYWEREGNQIPQVIVTDTFIQDAYALSWDGDPEDNGVMLASYTWEDDSLKLLPFDQEALVGKVVSKIKDITLSTIGEDITQFFRLDHPVSLQWIMQPSYVGCAKLYRQRNEGANALDLSFNQNYGGASHLYFIGENYSVEGGWTEPALRSAMDGVMQLLNDIGATFQVEGFDFATDYPKWPT